MAITNFENATLSLLIVDTDGIVTSASLQQSTVPIVGSSSIVLGEIPSGDIDGNNAVFNTAHDISGNQLAVYKNGLRQQLTADYTITGANQFTMSDPPITGDILVTDYVEAS